jgi:hypothetical protein
MLQVLRGLWNSGNGVHGNSAGEKAGIVHRQQVVSLSARVDLLFPIWNLQRSAFFSPVQVRLEYIYDLRCECDP